ncbi:MAG: T9SS type A sorting domain-containing protein [Bacteroidetes bacterium]|nr:T9SS type A sorting domain-containing protein [Bacteroidota bacterium]
MNLRSGVYLGKLNLSNNSIKGQIISYDSMDLGYPSISLVGNYALDEKCIINASFVKKNGFAGVLALYKDRNDVVHAPLMLKYGLSSINVQTNPSDTIERWGDYSGIQQIYGDPNSVILSHYYARNTNTHGTWIAKLTLLDSLNEFTSIHKNISNAHRVVYNNPFENNLELMYEMTNGDWVDISLYDLQGVKTKTLLRDFYSPGKYKFSMNTEELKRGIYILEIASEKNGDPIRKKIVRE